MLISFQGCTTPQEHKWLFYELGGKDGSVYQGYSTTSKDSYPEPEPVLAEGETKKVDQKDEHATSKLFTSLDKPTIDEDDQLHFVVFGSMLSEAACHFVGKPYTQTHDSKLAPQYTQSPPQSSPEELLLSEVTKKSVDDLQKSADELDAEAKQLEDKLDRAKQDKKSRAYIDEAKAKAIEAREKAQAASNRLEYAKGFVKGQQAQQQKMQEAAKTKSIVCDLDVREKGSTKIEFSLLKNQKLEPKDIIKKEDILLKDSVLVHELYRYRILAGPVFSTLQKRNKTYELRPNNAGQSVITAIPAQDHPANFALLLKVYHTKRDTLNPPSLSSFSTRWHEMINPIIGINLLDKPLQNFYAGFSFEPWGGFDIIGGVHWAKTQQLVDGFAQGQATTQASGLTKERFNNGWFVGVAADIGIITAWLKSAGSGILTATKATP